MYWIVRAWNTITKTIMVSSRDDNETTPLLSRIAETPEIPHKKSSPKLIYSYIFGILYLLIIFVYYIRNTLPIPLSDVEAREQNDFPGIHCYNEYLSHFNSPHSANQKGNIEIKNWIVNLANEFKLEAKQNGIDMEIIDNDPTVLVSKRNKFINDEYWLVESRNVIIRLIGKTNNLNESFLINAHYDSVSTSHGVTDNGMGTAVAIELLRYFVQHPPQHTIIFLFNNFEEGGLIGADAFVNHPWFSTIKLFVNLEGTGAGGRALLFRSNSLAAVHGLASSNAHYLHASPLGNDLLQAKLLKSDTDYTTFTKHGVPGLDFSFYYPRSHYHTQRDDLAHTTPQSLQHMGQMALASVLSIDNSETIVPKAGKPEPVIYYDILGRFMLVYSFFTCQFINIISLILVPIGLFTWFWFSSNGHIDERKERLKHNFILISQGFVAVLIALVFMIVFVALFSWIMLMANPSATYGSIKIVVLYLTAAALLGLLVSQWVLIQSSRTSQLSLANMKVGFYGLTVLWYILLVYATYLGSKKVTAVYFAIYFFLSSTVSTVVLVNTTPKQEEDAELAFKGGRYWPIVYLLQICIPVVFMSEFLLLVMDSMRHTSADGTPESSIYLLLSLPIILMLIHLLPWVHKAAEIQKTTFCTSVVFVALFIICFMSSPFDGETSPNRIIFQQEYNATESLSTVALITGSSGGILQKTLKSILPRSEYDTVQCESYLTYQTRCTYQTSLTPLYARDPKKEIKVAYSPTHCDEDRCYLNINTTAEHSLLCQLQLSHPARIQGLQAKINDYPIQTGKEDIIQALTVYSKESVSVVRWDLSFTSNQKAEDVGEVMFSCIYDDWTEGELPAFNTLRNNLPFNTLLSIKGGVGLAKVHYYPSIPLLSNDE
ncbi:uncharacterized protein BX663DRAFT_486809 [Cokeromyces recurvatus]|uniref:uncharacterized protein n=1 Tax=Cokeromyces recurvatus TaxID=90255 RepID=UPI00221E89DC|nr:uncharacterized protein BX663DRAFT_486809 [Cokeromyces recurvatus]KAI7902512.1 hypothetical protein BX663DRAFT_486809 [Cokeromyces recurvatus]